MNDPIETDPRNARIGVIGGSGLYKMQELNNINELDIETPYGKTSDKLFLGEISGFEVVFLARHSRNHSLTPSEVPYQANIWAMKSLGVRWIISASAVGSLQEDLHPLDILIPDQFIDRTKSRPSTFFGNGAVAHVSMAEPFCSNLSLILKKSASPLMPGERKISLGGTYLCMEGPAFSTRAESELYRKLGCSVIGMTNHTEARLAKEAEIAYASLAMITDYDCWHDDHENVTVEMIIDNLNSNAKLASQIIYEAIIMIGRDKPKSSSHNALKDALLTQKENVPPSTMEKIKIFTQRYWN